MSYANTWAFTPNQLAVDTTSAANIGKSFGLQFINALIAGGWTCVLSSNGTTTASSNLITSIAAIIGAASGTAHSYIVLGSPIGFVLGADNTGLGEQSRCYITISWLSTTYTSLSMTLHRELPTGGTGSVNPTSPNQVSVMVQAQVTRTTLANVPRFHFGTTTKGHFWAAVSYETTGIFPTLIVAAPLTGQTIVNTLAKLYPYDVAIAASYSDATSSPTFATLVGSGTFAGFSYTGAASITNAGLGMSIGLSQSGGDFNSNVPYTDWYVECGLAGYRGLVGRVTDIYITSALAAVNGATVIGTSPITHACFGAIAVPCNVSLLA